MKLYFITGNVNKFNEVKAILPKIEQLNIDLPEIQEINAKKIIEAKLKTAFAHNQGQFIVEDTSLYLDCLNGLPGPLIKWFLKTLGRDGIYALAEKYGNFQAQAKTLIGYANDNREIKYFEGLIRGKIIASKAQSNFGWDPIFQPDSFTKSFADMTREEKNKISMRSQAVEKLKKYLKP